MFFGTMPFGTMPFGTMRMRFINSINSALFASTLALTPYGVLLAECNNDLDQAAYASSAAALDNSDTTAEFTWLQSTAGRVTARNTLSISPEEACRVCVYARIKAFGEDQADESKRIACKRARAGRRIVSFKAFAMPGIASNLLVNLATRTTCGDEVIESDAFARNPTCGFLSSTSSGSGWLRLLKRRLR